MASSFPTISDPNLSAEWQKVCAMLLNFEQSSGDFAKLIHECPIAQISTDDLSSRAGECEAGPSTHVEPEGQNPIWIKIWRLMIMLQEIKNRLLDALLAIESTTESFSRFSLEVRFSCGPIESRTLNLEKMKQLFINIRNLERMYSDLLVETVATTRLETSESSAGPSFSADI
ncbi:hypothetical protein QAD02_001706, partial [Eretmocerus hayati]